MHLSIEILGGTLSDDSKSSSGSKKEEMSSVPIPIKDDLLHLQFPGLNGGGD